MFKFAGIILLFLSLSFSAQAKKIAGVDIDDNITLAGQKLNLNGAGIRTKFVFDIYVAAFYTNKAVKSMSQVSDDAPMRMAMHFVYDEVSKEKLVDGWNDGFEDNLSDEKLKKLKSRIDLFNSFFETVHKGDVINLDYVPGKGTLIYINNKNKGLVAGSEFYQALLMIWLGEDPVGSGLKYALLGKTDSDDD